ncbi:MAG: glycoside hydrolase domain-containing protein [Thermoguttaceae bacterium]
MPTLSSTWLRRLVVILISLLAGLIAAGGDAISRAAEPRDSLHSDGKRSESLAAFRAAFEKIRGQVQRDAAARPDLAVGFATSMEKVLPRNGALHAATKTAVELQLARGEKESFQVLVAPFERDVRQVAIRIGDLRSADGGTLAGKTITAAPVGYVRTKAAPPYGSSTVGWWPDPILDFLSAADIAKGDVQAFWVRVCAPRGQKPGIYQGQLDVLADGARAFSFNLSVQVYPFQLPKVSPLPLAITFSPEDSPLPGTAKQQAEWRKSDAYPVRAWRKHKLRWADFLADYYITYDSLYHSGLPDAEVLAHLHQQGRLGKYNLGYYGQVGSRPEDVQKWKSENLPRFHAAYAQAKELGVLNHAYIYGCDEAPAELFPQVQQAAAILKAEFPDVPVMTTTYDPSYGQESVIKAMDAFCPLTPVFDPAKAAKARAAGKQVWWYICCGPHHPYANMFIEYPAIDGRILMGAMTAKFRPDGFLYYQISIWNSQHPITRGPFTDWEPRSWTSYHGDGSWTCIGPDGTPLPTIRLENFRDGLEDFAYVRILEAAVTEVEASPRLRAEKAAWLQRAKSLLSVPAEVVRYKTHFTADPQVLYRYRSALADAIVAAGAGIAQK